MSTPFKLFIFSLFINCLTAQTIFSQNYSTKDNYTGAWATPTSWNPTWAIPQTDINGSDITINGYITLNTSLTFSGNADNLIINDTLVIKGDLTLTNKDNLTINDNGILIVRGNMTIDNKAIITSNGYIIVTGNFTKNGSVIQASFTSNDEIVKVFIGGTITPDVLTNRPNFPALNCTNPINPYTNSTCTYGNMQDLVNDPIYNFFLSTCIPTPTIGTNGPTTFCAGGSVTLTSSAGSAYLWSTGATTASINVTTSGSYSVQITSESGCQSAASVPTTVTVYAIPAIPTITAGGSTTFCVGGSVSLTSSGGSDYLWSTGATGSSINVTASGSYSVQITSANGCQSAASVPTMVTVNALPETPTITAGGPTTFCAGGNVTLTSSISASYLWSNGATTPSISVNTSGSYSVRVINSNGCQSAPSVIKVVTVNALPATPTITSGGPTTFCAGGSVTLTSSAGSGYLWSTGANTASINVTATGNYTVIVANSNGCQSAVSIPVVVTVNALPSTPTITPGGPTTFCSGQSVILTSSVGSTYLWSNGSTSQSTNITATGSYTVQVTNANGCQGAVSVPTMVTVNSLPVATITAGGPTTFCNGGNVVLTSSAGVSYLWSNGEITPSINVTTSGNYKVQVTNASGCQSSESSATTVNVNPLPVVNAGTDATIANGTSTTIDATVTGTGPFSYSWSPLGQLVDASIEDPTTLILTSSTVFTLSVTSATTSCTNTGEVTITVSGGALGSSPTSTPSTICSGSNIQLRALANGGSGSYTYTWTSIPAGFTSSIANPIDNPTTNTTYNVAVFDGSTTVNAQVAVNVNNLPAMPTITANGPITFCSGGSVILSSITSSSYLWSTGETSQSIDITSNGSFTLRVTDANGCQSLTSAPTIVKVNDLPITPTITVAGPTSFCDGGSVTLTSSTSATYLWSNTATSQSVNITLSGSYSVRVVSVDGCQSDESVPTIVTVNALPVKPTISAEGSTTFCAGGTVTLRSSPGASYLWSNGEITESINIYFTGSYAVIISNSSGCQSLESVPQIITVNTLPSTPTITADGPTTFCSGGMVTLTSSASSTYLWSDGSANQSIIVSMSGIYSVQATDMNGCHSAASLATNVTVNALPTTPTIISGGPTAFCAGDSVILNSSAGSAYLWSNGATMQSIDITNSGSYTVSVTNANGCISAMSVPTIVVVNDLPVKPTITSNGSTSFCDGGNVTLTSSSGSDYLWTNGSIAQNITIYKSGSYSLRVTNANGCISEFAVPVIVSVNDLPATPIIIASGPTTFCEGGSVTLTSSPGSSYLWSNAETAPSINITTSGSYNVQITNSSGCKSNSSPASVITVRALPVAIASNSGPICSGNALSLMGGTSGMNSYSWAGPNQFMSSLQNPLLSANATSLMAGNYTLTITDLNGCVAIATTSVIINDSPLVSITSSDESMCTNDSRTLTANPAGGTFIITSGSGSITNNVLSATRNGNINLEYQISNICANKAAQSIKVNSYPNANAGLDQKLVFVLENQMDAELSNSETGEWTLISGSGIISDIHSPTSMISGLSIGNNVFRWKVRNENCEASADVTITVNNIFVPSVITPNNDGKNDYFRIIEIIGKAELIILNQWGNVEYSNSNYLNDWDGRNNKGFELHNDTYFYILKFDNGITKKGSVLIKR